MLGLSWGPTFALPNIDRTTLLHRGHLYWVFGDEEVV